LSPTIGGDDDLLALIVRNGGEFGSIPIQMRNEDGPRGQVDVVEFAVFTLGGFIANHLLLCVQEAFGQREEYVQTEYLYNIQCSEIFTLRIEKLHTGT